MGICKYVVVFFECRTSQLITEYHYIHRYRYPKTEHCMNIYEVHNSIAEGMVDTTSTCDNLLHLQIWQPRTSTLPHGQAIAQTGGQFSGQISE